MFFAVLEEILGEGVYAFIEEGAVDQNYPACGVLLRVWCRNVLLVVRLSRAVRQHGGI